MLRTQSILYKPNAIAAQQISQNIANLQKKQLKLAIPDVERLNPMRKVTDKINIKDELHPFEPLKNLRHEISIKTKKLAAAGNGKDPDDDLLKKYNYSEILKKIDNTDIYKKYKNNLLEKDAIKNSFFKKDI